MKYLLYLFQIIIIQYTSAQLLTLGGSNYIPNLNNGANIPIAASLGNGLGFSNGVGLANIGQTGAIELANANIAGLNVAQGINGNYLNAGNIEVIGANGIENVAANVAYDNNRNIASLASYANVVQPPRQYGIEFSADALEMGGQVAVSGRMPFNANVAVKGSVAAQGQGSISYKCDKMSADDS